MVNKDGHASHLQPIIQRGLLSYIYDRPKESTPKSTQTIHLSVVHPSVRHPSAIHASVTHPLSNATASIERI